MIGYLIVGLLAGLCIGGIVEGRRWASAAKGAKLLRFGEKAFYVAESPKEGR